MPWKYLVNNKTENKILTWNHQPIREWEAPPPSPPEGYIAWWKFDGNLQDAAGNYPDASAYSLTNGTPFSPSYTTGKNGQAIIFAEDASLFLDTQLHGDTIFSLRKEYSIGTWIKFLKLTFNQYIFGNRNLACLIDNGNAVYSYRNGYNNSMVRKDGLSLNDGNWHFLCLRYGNNDSSTGGPIYDLFLDNNFYTSATSFGDFDCSPSGHLAIGSDSTTTYPNPGAYNNYFYGYMDSFIVYNKRLTDNEVLQLYNDGAGF